MDEQMHLSGQLSDWSVADLLQIMQVTNKTGSLDIVGDRRGRLHFRDGKVTGAELLGGEESRAETERDVVADIVYVLSSMDDGTFTVGSVDGPDGEGYPAGEVLNDIDALRSVEAEVLKSGLLDAASIGLADDLERPITLDPEDWHALVTLVRPFTFGDLDIRLGRGAAIRVLHMLQRLGIADAMFEEVVVEEPVVDLELEGSGPTWIEESETAQEEPEPEFTPEQELESEPEPELESEPEPAPVLEPVPIAEQREPEHALRGVAAPASTTLTDGVYDEIRRLRSKAAEK